MYWTLLRELRGEELLPEIGTLDRMPPALVELADARLRR
jgi:hypothetical protein